MYLLKPFIYSSLLQYVPKQLPLPPFLPAIPPTSPLDPLLTTSVFSQERAGLSGTSTEHGTRYNKSR